MKHYLKIVEVAIEHDSKFLIIKRPEGATAAGLLAFPGGKVDEEDEKHSWGILREAAIREVKEEVGLDLVDPLNYVNTSFFKDESGTNVIDTIFHCKINKTKLNVKPSTREVPEYYWLTKDEINKAKNSPPWLKLYLTEIETN